MGEVVCFELTTDGETMNDNSSRTELKRSHGSAEDACEAEVFPNKKLSKGGSNNESNSEVLNPNVSLQEDGSSSETVSSQTVDRPSQPICDEILSTSAGNLSTEIAANKEQCINDLSASIPMKSEVVLEASKPTSVGGVRRIVFKFSKSKGPNNAVSHPSTNEVDSGNSCSRFHAEHEMSPLELVDSSADMLLCTSGSEHQLFCSPRKKMELKMSKKVVLNSYPTSVKKLLSTGILEGVTVKYIKEEKELLHGVIRDCGYLCGCALCNFSRVVNAFEFEQHAGCKTKHPNNHIFLDNGKSIYSIVQELRKIPLSSLNEVIHAVVGSSVNEKSYLVWKESFETSQTINHQQHDGESGKHKHSQLRFCESPHSIISCPSEATEEALSSLAHKFHVKQSFVMQKASKEQRLVSKKLNSDAPNSVVVQRSTNGGRHKKRDNDLHRLLFMANGLPDGAELAYYSKGQRLLKGYKQGNGIMCSCCNSEISPSQFEAHAGWATRRQPYRHIYTSNGVSLHDLSISLANGQSLTAGDSDDICTVCGDGGDLILCDGCPRAFHTGCLELQCTPDGDWYCPYCKDKIELGGKALTESSCGIRRITIRLTRVVKAPESEIGGCFVCRAHDFSVSKFDERTVMLCDQCEKEYHVGCLRGSGLCDLKELPKGKWFCCDDCSRIHTALQKLFLSGPEVIPPSLSSSINRKLIEKGLTEELGNNVQWQLLSGKVGSLCDRSLLSRAAAIFRECFDPIVERSGRDLIPAMVYGRNIAGQEFGGMYCAVLSVKSVVVSAGVLRIFGREVAELPLVATTRHNQGKGYFQALFSCIERLLCYLNVENIVLPAAEEAVSIWTNKLGFRKMTEDRFQKYTRDIQLMTFKGTSMLEKAVPRIIDEQATKRSG